MDNFFQIIGTRIYLLLGGISNNIQIIHKYGDLSKKIVKNRKIKVRLKKFLIYKISFDAPI